MTAKQENPQRVHATKEAEWGETRNDHFGYSDEEERISKRGLEDWELVEKILADG